MRSLRLLAAHRSLVALAVASSGLVYVSACLAAGPEDYPLVDSRIGAPATRVSLWLDNDRVVFFGIDQSKLVKGKSFREYERPKDARAGNTLYRDDQFVWNVRTGAVERTIRPMYQMCAYKGEVGYLSEEPSNDPVRYWYSGVYGKETRQPWPERHWLNPHSCRMYTTLPPWEKARRKGHIPDPLLERDGYIDVGPDGTPREGFPLLVRPDLPQSPVALSALWNAKARWLFRYAPHADAYMVDNLDHFPAAFLMTPQGQLRKADFPKDSPRRYGFIWHTRQGFFYRSLDGRNNVEDTRTVGGYILTEKGLSRVVVGKLDALSVSPDGCGVAFSHSPSEKAHYDGLESFRRGGLSNTTMKMINVCNTGRRPA